MTATYSSDANFNGSSDTELHEVVPVNVVVKDSHVAEPPSGTTSMLFTVTLSAPATGAASVNYATADNGSAVGGADCLGGADYVTTSGFLNFNTGQQIQTISVVVCSDGTAEPDETFIMNLSTPVNLTITDGTATGTITAANPPGTVLISEVRTSGPGGGDYDFVEIYNNTSAPLIVSASDASAGYALYKMGAACGDSPVLIGTIPNGTNIPARGQTKRTQSIQLRVPTRSWVGLPVKINEQVASGFPSGPAIGLSLLHSSSSQRSFPTSLRDS